MCRTSKPPRCAEALETLPVPVSVLPPHTSEAGIQLRPQWLRGVSLSPWMCRGPTHGTPLQQPACGGSLRGAINRQLRGASSAEGPNWCKICLTWGRAGVLLPHTPAPRAQPLSPSGRVPPSVPVPGASRRPPPGSPVQISAPPAPSPPSSSLLVLPLPSVPSLRRRPRSAPRVPPPAAGGAHGPAAAAPQRRWAAMGDEAARRGDGSDRGEGGGSGSQRRKRPKKVAGGSPGPSAPPGVGGGGSWGRGGCWGRAAGGGGALGCSGPPGEHSGGTCCLQRSRDRRCGSAPLHAGEGGTAP